MCAFYKEKGMRILFTAIATLLIAGCSSLDATPVTDTDMTRTRVVEVTGTNKADLYERARQFIAHNYGSAKAVTQYESAEAGRVIGKGIMQVDVPGFLTTMPIKYTITIDTKDDKARISLSDYYAVNEAGVTTYKANYRWQQLATEQPSAEVMEQFAQYIANPAQSESDW